MLGKRRDFDVDRQGRVQDGAALRWAHRGAVAWLAGLVLAALLPVHAGAIEPQGAVYTWGDNGSGQLGRGGNAANPGAVALDQITQVAAGRVHSVAVKADGLTVYTWGGNIYGQLGNGSLSLQSGTPQSVAINDGAVRKTVKSVAAGADHTLALTTDGQVWAWGNNASAQLALDPNRIAFSRVPRRISFSLPAGVTVTDIAAGDSFSLARTSDGAVYGWGDNARGQLGPALLTGNETVRLTITPTPVGVTGATAIGAGSSHSLAITAANAVLAWGEGDPVPRAITLPDGAAPAAVDGGRTHSLVRLADGRVVSATATAASVVPGLAGVTSVNARLDTSIAVANGAVYTFTPQTPPAKASVSDTAVAAAAGDSHNVTALAPRAALTTTDVTFEGITEVGRTTAPQTITVSNAGPGALRIGAVAFQEGQADYALAPNGDTCSNATVAANASCTINVVFKPVAAGPRDSFLTIDHDAFGGDTVVQLHGQAIVLSGGLNITTAPHHLTDGVPASPSSVPLTDIPLQPESPAIADAQAAGELPLGDLIGIGELPLGDLIGIGELPLGDVIGIGELPLGDLIGIGELPLGDVIGIGELPLGDLIGIGDPVRDFLGGVTLSSVPLAAPHSWDAILAGTQFEGRPLQEVTLLEALSNETAASRFNAVPLRAVGWSASRLGGIGLLSFLVGDTPLSAISGHDWCAQLNAAGLAGCGAGYGRKATPSDGLSSSPLEFDLAGIGLGRLNTAAVQLGQIGNPDALVFQLLLDRIDLYRSDLGSIKVAALPNTNAVVDCSKADCHAATTTLASAQGARAIKAGADIGDLGSAVAGRTLGRLIAGILPLDADTFGAVPLERMGIKGYAANDGVDTHKFDYQVSFANTSGNALPAGTTVSVKLPDSFVYVPGSSTMRIKGTGAATPVADPTASGRTFTWSLPTNTLNVANGQTLLLDFQARPGFRLGTFTVNEVAISTPGNTVRTTAPSAPVRVVDGLEDNDTPAAATPIREGELKISHVSSSKDRDYFAFDAAGIEPGSRIVVHLDHQQGGDADLVLYGAPGMVGEPVLRGGAASSGTPVVPLKELLPAINGADTSLQSDVQYDVHREAGLPLLGISQNRDARDEQVTALALAPTGSGAKYVIEVNGYNGSFYDLPYSLRLSIEPPAAPVTAPARTFPHPADPTFTATPQTAAAFAGATTLFITAPGRLQRLYGAAAANTVVAALKDARLTPIIGAYGVLNADADPAVRAAYAAWDANPADPRKANDVVRAVNALADRLAPMATMQNVVIVGGDDVVPMARIVDLTSTVSERLYAREAALRTTPANALVGAAAAGRFLSDDAYADVDPTALPGAQFLYLPTAAIGRLVDTPAQITAVLNQFMQFGGVVDPKTALTTSGAPFLDDVADEINTALGGKGVTRTSLTAQTWGKSDLAAAWANSAPGIVAFNGHSDPSRTQARNGELFTASDLAAANLNRELVLTVGCHTGLPVADGVLRLPTQQSWASTLLDRGAAGYAAQTGYGLGSRSTVALTEKVMLGFTKALGTSSVGQSLVTAKAQYATEGGPADVLDAKALMQATFFGMPHLRFANAAPQPPAAPALNTGTDPATGLPAAFLDIKPAFTKHTTPDGSYYSVDGRTVSVAGRPVQPLVTQDVTRPGLRAHGVAFTGLTSTDADGSQFDPVLPRPVAAGIGSPDDELQAGDLAFPAALQAVRSANGKDTAAIIPALFASTGLVNGKTVGLERRFTALEATVLYAPADNTDFTPPTVLSSRGVTSTAGDAVTFVVDAPEAVDVTVLLKEDGSDVWRHLRLAKTAGGSLFAGGTTVNATKVEYFVQAVDGSANVAVMGNKGRLLVAEPLVSKVGAVGTAVTGVGAPANPAGSPDGWFRTATLAFNVTDPSVIVTARVDGGDEGPANVIQFAGDGVANPPPGAVRGDGHHVITYTATDGSRGTVVVRIDNAGPQIAVANPRPDGSSFFVTGSSPKASYRCTDAGSGASSCTGTVANGAALPMNTGTNAFVVNAADLAGHTSSLRVDYQVGYRFEGFLEPVQNRPVINTWSSGQTVPMKWRLYDANNNVITATSTFAGAGSYEFACSGVPAPPPGQGTPTASQSGLSQTGDGFQYGWSTQKQWKGTCRRFVLRLDDGTIHLADFRFS